MRVVLDANIFISALLSRAGAPVRVLLAWQRGEFDVVISPLLIAELRRALAYPKLRRRITADEAERFVEWLARTAILVADPADPPPVRSADPGDDYLLALAASEAGILVSGDDHLLALPADLPVRGPVDFLDSLDAG